MASLFTCSIIFKNSKLSAHNTSLTNLTFTHTSLRDGHTFYDLKIGKVFAYYSSDTHFCCPLLTDFNQTSVEMPPRCSSCNDRGELRATCGRCGGRRGAWTRCNKCRGEGFNERGGPCVRCDSCGENWVQCAACDGNGYYWRRCNDCSQSGRCSSWIRPL